MTERATARVIELHGNPSKLPEAEVEARSTRRIEPDAYVPAPPDFLTPGGRAVWRELVAELEKDALVTKRDRYTLGLVCVEVEIMRAALDAMRPDKRRGYVVIDEDPEHRNRLRRHPALIVYGQAVDRFRRLASEFGLSPRMRQALEVGGAPVPDDGDDDDDLDA